MRDTMSSDRVTVSDRRASVNGDTTASVNQLLSLLSFFRIFLAVSLVTLISKDATASVSSVLIFFFFFYQRRTDDTRAHFGKRFATYLHFVFLLSFTRYDKMSLEIFDKDICTIA